MENFRALKVQKNVINMQSINAIYVTFDSKKKKKKIARPERLQPILAESFHATYSALKGLIQYLIYNIYLPQ